ncbi:MAG: hypothetical protein NE327_06820 [Lentisphaeraceae bacterium]|nr:hypothetical protein [Lentisphaeraceae bacterium]
MNKAFLPILIIATGCGWLLSSKNVVPGVDWAWVLLMASTGIIVLLNKINKMTIVLGPMLLIGSVMFVMLQTQTIAIDMLFPVLVISFGVLMLIARTSKLPDAFKEEDTTESGDHK